MKISIFTLWSLILAVCLKDCLTAPITNYEDRAFKRRRRPCGRDASGKTFGNAVFLGDVTITQVSCGGYPGNNKPGLFSKPGQGIKPGIYGGNKPGGNKPGGGHGSGGGFLNSVFGDGGIFGGNGGIFSDGGFLGGGGGGGSGAHTGGATPAGSGGSGGGGIGSGLGNILNNIFGGFRPQLPQIIGGPGGGTGPLPSNPLPEDPTPVDIIPEDPVSEDDQEEPIKPVFEEIPEDPVTELYKPLPLVGSTNQYVQGYSQDLTNFKPGRVISGIGKQFNHYLINPFVDLFT